MTVGLPLIVITGMLFGFSVLIVSYFLSIKEGIGELFYTSAVCSLASVFLSLVAHLICIFNLIYS